MTEIKLTKRYPQSRTEDIVDAYMRGWNDALDAVQNGKFIINDDRKTENCSEKTNNSTISKMEQVDWKDQMWIEAVEDEPQTELVRVKYHCINCAENGSYKCSKCDGEMYYKYDKDEPQTERSE